VLSVNQDFEAAVAALTRYQELAPPAEARKADELLGNLKKSLAASKGRYQGRRGG
jgi:hypothetical protein